MEQAKNVEEPVSEESEDNEELVFSKTDMDNTGPDPNPDPAPVNWTLKQKVIYYSDRVFLCFLGLLLLVLLFEVLFKIWYFTKWTSIFNYLRYLASYLTAQEEQEEGAEL